MRSDSQIVVRPAVHSADLDHVRSLMREYGGFLASFAHIDLPDYEFELERLPEPYTPPGALFLAFVEGRPAGCIALKMLRSVATESDTCASEMAFELKRLWVGHGFRGLRLGQRLMRSAIDYARAAGADAVYLDTVPAAMPEANRLYDALGFQQVGRYNDNPVPDVVFFKLSLTAAK